MRRLSFVIGMVAALAAAAGDASAQGRRDRGQGRGEGRGWERGERMQPMPMPPMPQGRDPEGRYPGASGRYREVERYQQQQRSWGRGDRLPPGYGAIVPNPGQYRLRQPPPGYSWVQRGRDLYLMQQGTGLVLEAIPGGF